MWLEERYLEYILAPLLASRAHFAPKAHLIGLALEISLESIASMGLQVKDN